MLQQFKEQLCKASGDELNVIKRTISDASSKSDTIDMLNVLNADASPQQATNPPKIKPPKRTPPKRKATAQRKKASYLKAG